jgi:hypothetical protein
MLLFEIVLGPECRGVDAAMSNICHTPPDNRDCTTHGLEAARSAGIIACTVGDITGSYGNEASRFDVVEAVTLLYCTHASNSGEVTERRSARFLAERDSATGILVLHGKTQRWY